MKDKTFNISPVLEVIEQDGPLETVQKLSELHDMVADYMLADAGLDPTYAKNQLFLLRQLRNAVAQGAGITAFEK